jgi:hypothetical protein
MNEDPENISNKKLAFCGAMFASATVLFYSIIVAIYVLIRSSSTIYNVILTGDKILTLVENGISVIYSIAIFSIIMAIISSIIGVAAAIILKKSLLYFNPHFNNKRAILITGLTSIVILSLIYLVLHFLLKALMTLSYVESFLFWYLFPAILFLIVSIVSGKKLNELFKNLNTKNHA